MCIWSRERERDEAKGNNILCFFCTPAFDWFLLSFVLVKILDG